MQISRFFIRDIHCHKLGYVKAPRRRAAPASPPVMLQITNGTAEPSERSSADPTPPLRSHGNYVSAVPIAFAAPGFHPTPVKTEPAAPGEPMGCSPSPPNIQKVQVMNQTSSPSMKPGIGSTDTRKRRNDESALIVAVKRQAMQDLVGSCSATDQVSSLYYRQPCCSSKLVLFLVHTWHIVALIAMWSQCYIDLALTKQNRYASIWESESWGNFPSWRWKIRCSMKSEPNN